MKTELDGGFVVHLKSGLKARLPYPSNPENIKITSYKEQLIIRVFRGRIRINSRALVIFSGNKEEYRISIDNIISVISTEKPRVIWLNGIVTARAA